MASVCPKSAVVAVSAVLVVAGTVAALAAERDSVVATVGNYKITDHELEQRVKAPLQSLEMQLYELKKAAVQEMADDYLLEQAARKAHLTVAAYLKREVDDKVLAPSDAQLHQLYNQLRPEMRGPFDQMKPTLVADAKKQETMQRREALLAKLRAAHETKFFLKPPRTDVAVGDRPALGPEKAPVTIIEFGDFENPFCKRAEAVLSQVRAKYGNKVRLIFADFPLAMHVKAFEAARAARCAGEQGKFWPYHDALFADQSKLAPGDLKATAARLKLDTAKFNECFDKKKYDADVKKDIALADSAGVDGTPAFFINGRPLLGPQPLQKFTEVIDEELASSGTRQARSRN